MQAVKMRFKPLASISYDTDIIIEREKRLNAIVGGNKGVYTPRLYPTTNKKPYKTPCNTVVYIRMYTTIASRLKGYTSHYKERSENVQKLHCLKLAAVSICRYQKEDQTSGNLIDDQFRLSESFGGITWKHLKSLIYYPSVPSVKKSTLLFSEIFSIHYCNVYLLDV